MSQTAPVPDGLSNLSLEVRRNIRFATVEGSLSNVMGTLVGGAFLTGFALLLGAQESHIGLLAAIPPLLNLTQLFGSLLIRRFGSRRRLCLLAIGASRATWLGILAIPFLFLGNGFSDLRVWLLMAGIALVSFFSAAAGAAWLSWLTDLVPSSLRGRFNGRRSMYAGVAAMIAGLAGGRLIELLGGRESMGAFSALFGIGVAFGFLGLLAMARISEPPAESVRQPSQFLSEIKEPFTQKRFLAFSGFVVAWSFAVSIASPFFSVYMIRGLGISFSVIAALGVVSSLSTILGMRLWGGVMDRIGPKPLLLLCAALQATVPLWWLTASPENLTPLWLAHALAGFVSAGTGLANTGLLVQVTPDTNTAPFFGVHAAMVGAAGAAAPLIAGAAGIWLAESRILLGPLQLEGLRIIFFVSALLRGLSLFALGRVDAGRPLESNELAAVLRRVQSLVPAFGANQAVGVGLAAVENVNLSIARGSTVMERAVERQMQKGWETWKRAQGAAKRVDDEIDTRLMRHEDRLDQLIDRAASWWQRLRSRWTRRR